jgi:hypothetical protein
MIEYFVVCALFVPCILSALNLIACDKRSEASWFFSPMRSRCDAVFVLSSILVALVITVVTVSYVKGSYDNDI